MSPEVRFAAALASVTRELEALADAGVEHGVLDELEYDSLERVWTEVRGLARDVLDRVAQKGGLISAASPLVADDD